MGERRDRGVVRRVAKALLPAGARHRLAPRPHRPRADRADMSGACPLPGGVLLRRADGSLPSQCLPLEDPTWVPATDAPNVVDDDAVLGFVLDGVARAVAWDVMVAHHIVNIDLGDRAYVLTLCPVCAGGGLFEATMDGTTLHFRVDGLYSGTPYVVDRETGSLWTMVTMQPLHGPALQHGALTRHPMVQTTWQHWRQLHRDTLVLDHPGEPEDGRSRKTRAPDHRGTHRFPGGRERDDPRLDPTELVLGVEVDGSARAYPLARLHAAGGVVNDVLGGAPIVAVGVPGSHLAVAFRRDVDGEALDLAWADAAPGAGGEAMPTLIDSRTGSGWDLLGTAISGPLEGQHLRYVWSGIQKWFNWSNLSPATDVWEGSSNR